MWLFDMHALSGLQSFDCVLSVTSMIGSYVDELDFWVVNEIFRIVSIVPQAVILKQRSRVVNVNIHAATNYGTVVSLQVICYGAVCEVSTPDDAHQAAARALIERRQQAIPLLHMILTPDFCQRAPRAV